MIRLENLTKLYGSFVAVDDISLHVPRGVLYGCLGPNGAGKTTTLRMIAGILRPTQGRAARGVRADELEGRADRGVQPRHAAEADHFERLDSPPRVHRGRRADG